MVHTDHYVGRCAVWQDDTRTDHESGNYQGDAIRLGYDHLTRHQMIRFATWLVVTGYDGHGIPAFEGTMLHNEVGVS